MDDRKIIDLEKSEVLADNTRFICVDNLIAKTLVFLNKAGYKTLSSCSGHYSYPKMTLQQNVDLCFLEKAKKDRLMHVAEIRNNDFDCWIEDRTTSVYIMFDKKYDFLKLPLGFIQESNGTIRKRIEFFDSDKKRKPQEEIVMEIEKSNKILKDWAKELLEGKE